MYWEEYVWRGIDLTTNATAVESYPNRFNKARRRGLRVAFTGIVAGIGLFTI